MNNPFAMMGGMPGLAGLMGMGGNPGLNSGQLSSMWGGMGGPRGMGMPGMGGFNRGMMEQVRRSMFLTTIFLKISFCKSVTTFQFGVPQAPGFTGRSRGEQVPSHPPSPRPCQPLLYIAR